MNKKLKILIAPLDWGLGHTTRCLPIIRLLLSKGHQVTVAAPAPILDFVASLFPQVELLPLMGYNIKYSGRRSLFLFKLLTQIPRVLKVISREHYWLKQVLKEVPFDLVISDNRYGLHHAEVENVILTHQLSIKSGKGSFGDRKLQRLHALILGKFKHCWVVDWPGHEGIAGDLSKTSVIQLSVDYIGLLSQFQAFKPFLSEEAERELPLNSKPKIVFLLSGTEPGRSQLEQEIRGQCQALSPQYRMEIVGGRINDRSETSAEGEEVEKGIYYHSCLQGAELGTLLMQADLVICRSGYSSLMDLIYLKKRMALIPTPGQTEQEYLAQHFHQQFKVPIGHQGRLNLAELIKQGLATLPPFLSKAKSDGLSPVLNPLLDRIMMAKQGLKVS